MGKEQTFVNLLNDSGFKAVYADRKNKLLLISLLNLVLPDDVHVHDIVEYRDREQERDRVFYWFNNSYMAEEIPSCASDDPEMQSLVEATRIAAFPPEKKKLR